MGGGNAGAGQVGPGDGEPGDSPRKARPRPKKKPQEAAPPATAGTQDTGVLQPPAAPGSTSKRQRAKPAKSASGKQNHAEKDGIKGPTASTGKPKKSPKEKRAEKKSEREAWSQDAIDEAFRAAGGTPKDVDAGRHPSEAGESTPPPSTPGVGRPSKYQDMDLERIEAHARGGLTKAEIAWASGISYDTLREYEKAFPEFSAAITRGRARRVEDAEATLHMMASGFTIPEEKVHYDMQVGEWKKTTVLKVVTPDVKAQHLILQKAETGSWAPSLKHTGKVDHSLKGTITHEIDTAPLKDLLNGADSPAA